MANDMPAWSKNLKKVSIIYLVTGTWSIKRNEPYEVSVSRTVLWVPRSEIPG